MGRLCCADGRCAECMTDAAEDVCVCLYPDFNPDDPDITNCGACGMVLQ